jgi:subtilisin family serine protease
VVRGNESKIVACRDSLGVMQPWKRRRSLLGALIVAVAVASGLPALARGDDAVTPPEESLAAPVGVMTNEPTVEYVAGQLVVGLADEATRTQVQAAFEDAGATVEQSIGAIDTKVVELPAAQMDEAIDSLEESPAVEYVEPEVVLEATDTIPNDDALWQQQWGPRRVRAQKAWDATRGSPSVVVAVVDTGVDYAHPDLQGLFVDGYDFVNQDADPRDDQGHGTSVAGVIAARTQNREGQAGMCWTCKMMPVKVLDATGSGTTSTIAAGIVWAANHGAQVINLSLGGAGTTQALADAISFATGNGAVVLAAAGNSGSTTRFYPAAYPDALSVAATTPEDRLYDWSNRGQDWVQVAAPGCDVAPVRGGGYGIFCGTSAATPVASGIAALALSLDPGLSVPRLYQGLRAGAVGRMSSVQYGRVDAVRTLASLELIAPRNTRRPKIVGTVSSRATLEARNGGWLGATSFAYGWQRCDSAGRICVAIPGASATTYQLTQADIGATIRLVVTASNAHGATTARSAPTGVVTRGETGALARTASVDASDTPTQTSGEPAGGGGTPPPPPSEPPASSVLDALPPEVGQTAADVAELADGVAPSVPDSDLPATG